MEITIKYQCLGNWNTRHKYFDNEQEAQEFYNEAVKEYGAKNVSISKTLTEFYI